MLRFRKTKIDPFTYIKAEPIFLHVERKTNTVRPKQNRFSEFTERSKTSILFNTINIALERKISLNVTGIAIHIYRHAVYMHINSEPQKKKKKERERKSSDI